MEDRESLGIFYQAKAPTDNPADEFSSGHFDQTLALLVSKDIRRLHFDFNVVPQLFGRVNAGGHDFNTGFALSFSMSLKRRFSLVGEGYGATSLNPQNPAFASTTLAFTYQVNPRSLWMPAAIGGHCGRAKAQVLLCRRSSVQSNNRSRLTRRSAR